MKKLFTLALAVVCLNAHSQSGLMPYNPDSNGDALIGSEDLISLLGVYNTLMIDSSLTCDYEGTEFESWVGGLFDGAVILDSIYIEYLFIDSVEVFLPGCPDPETIYTVLDRSYWLTDGASISSAVHFSTEFLGYHRAFDMSFNSDNGNYSLSVFDAEISALTGYQAWCYWNFLGQYDACCDWYGTLPFPETWTLDEDGIQVDWDYWVKNSEYFRLIPFWHEAE